jgi:hypothetical protein
VHHDGPVCILKWSDKRNVITVSSYHGAEVQAITKMGKGKQKPVCVMHYNQYMGEADKKDQLL